MVDVLDDSQEVTRASGPARLTGVVDPTARIDHEPEESLSGLARVGRYHLEDRIGAGGMGVVLRARDPELGRVVAIKLLRFRRSPGSDESTKRLLREAQAMARLSHPNVIEIYHVGEVDGRVYIAMEYVAGQTLKDWVRKEKPSRRAILEAFVQAGRGLAAAHRVGLVHRDFKPTNVLRGGDGRVRVLDFGLATPPRRGPPRGSVSIDDGDLFDARVTATGLVMGTPAYMAPECHYEDIIDARSDQFSFCVALYEALYGERPFPGPSADEIADQAAKGVINLPSDVTLPARLRDAILRGLLPDPAERWPSMEALLDELRPARPARRWVGLAVVMGLAAAGLAVATLPSPPPVSTCDRAAAEVQEIWDETAGTQLGDAFASAGLSYADDTARRVRARLDAYATELASARRGACEARPLTAHLDARSACLDDRLADLRGIVSVLVRAEPNTVRNAVAAVGELEPIERCEHVRASTLPPPPDEVAERVQQGRRDLAVVRARLQAGAYESALALAEEVLGRARSLGYDPFVAEAQHLRGRALEARGEYEAAREQLTEALLSAEATGHDEVAAAAATRLVFVVGSQLERHQDAERWARHARAAIERLPPDHTAGLVLEATLGSLRWSQGHPAEARAHYERALEARRAQLGAEHPLTLTLQSNLALVCHELGDQRHARELMQRAIEDQRKVLGPDHPEVSIGYGNLGVIELAEGDPKAAEEHIRTALEGLRATVGDHHPHYPRLLTNLAKAEITQGRHADAQRHQQRALESFEQTMGPRSLAVGHALINLGAIHHDRGDPARARDAYRQGLAIWEEHMRPDHPSLAIALGNIAQADLELGKIEDAAEGFDRALALIEGARGPDHPSMASALVGRGRVRLAEQRPRAALEDLERAVLLREDEGGDPASLGEARFHLGTALWAAGRRVEARHTVERALSEVRHRDRSRLRAEVEAWLATHATAPEPPG